MIETKMSANEIKFSHFKIAFQVVSQQNVRLSQTLCNMLNNMLDIFHTSLSDYYENTIFICLINFTECLHNAH